MLQACHCCVDYEYYEDGAADGAGDAGGIRYPLAWVHTERDGWQQPPDLGGHSNWKGSLLACSLDLQREQDFLSSKALPPAASSSHG